MSTALPPPPDRLKLACLFALAPVTAFASAYGLRFGVLHGAPPPVGDTFVAGGIVSLVFGLLLAARAPWLVAVRVPWPKVIRALAEVAAITLVVALAGAGLRRGGPYSRLVLALAPPIAAGAVAAVYAAIRARLPEGPASGWGLAGLRGVGRGAIELLGAGRVPAAWLQTAAFAVPLVVAHAAMVPRARELRALGLQLASGISADLLFVIGVGCVLALAGGVLVRSRVARSVTGLGYLFVAFLAYANFEVFDSFGVQFCEDIAFIFQPRNIGAGGGGLVSDAVRGPDLVFFGLAPAAAGFVLLMLAARKSPESLGFRVRVGHALALLVVSGAVLSVRDTARYDLKSRPGAVGFSFFADYLPARTVRAILPSDAKAWDSPGAGALRALVEDVRPVLPGMVAPDPMHPFFHALPSDLCRYGKGPLTPGKACDADADADGHALRVDCDDTNPAVHPGATEVPGNGIDEDCDGRDGRRRNFAFIHFESLGAFDVQPLTDLFSELTPEFQRLTADGVLYTNAYSNDEPSDQARSAYLIGADGMDPAGIDRWAPVEGMALPDVLRSTGYRTATVLGAPLMFQGMARFFTVHPLTDAIGRERLKAEGVAPSPWTLARTDFIPYSDEQVYERSLKWLEQQQSLAPEAPWTLFVATGTTHWPFPSPPELAGFGSPTGPKNPGYDERHRAVRYADRELGKFVDALRRRPDAADTVIVIFGDHPPASMLYEPIEGVDKVLSQRWIPLLVIGAPELGAPGSRVADVVSLVDLPVTVMDLVGSRAANAFAGRSLARPVPSGPAACALVTKGGTAFVCPGVYCDRKQPRACRRLDRGAFVGDVVADPPFGLDWAPAVATYEEHLFHGVGLLVPAWYRHDQWLADHGIAPSDPISALATLGP